MNFEIGRVKVDEKDRVIFAIYPDGWMFERTFDDDYKNGEIPYHVIERMNGKKIYEREGDTVLFGQ